ncbi:MAG: hypothetical protein HY017_14380 [Betaproteobacteria bacterium]|nr:hypothetical protein [Betaproteobacteria bacterium]
MKALAVMLAAAAALLLSGCGTINATVTDAAGRDLMLLGHDPVSYFVHGKPQRGDPAFHATIDGKTYYFASAQHRALFLAGPQKYEPQFGGFCTNGVTYGVKLSSDPTEFEIIDGKLYIFGDVLGHEYWLLGREENLPHAHEMWHEAKDVPWVQQTIKRAIFNRVPWYQSGPGLRQEWERRNPGKQLAYDPGRSWYTWFVKYPGWRAREGHMQPALGIPGVDSCPPACAGEFTRRFERP